VGGIIAVSVLLTSKDEVTVVLPALNEENAVGHVVEELKAEGYRNILVVDGYSKDKTAPIAREMGATVIYQHGKGKAGAVRTALYMVNTPFMLVMDADYTYDPKDIAQMLNHISEVDEVIGMRKDKRNIPFAHRVGNRIISFAFGLLMGQKISDPCSGMYMLNTEKARGLELTSGGFDIEVEMAAQALSSGRVVEVPISYRERVGERKLSTWRAGFAILLTVLRMAWLYNPVFLFSSITALFTVPGAAVLLWQLFKIILHGVESWSLGWSWLGLVLLVIGVQGFTTSAISLLLKRMERRIIRATTGRREG